MRHERQALANLKVLALRQAAISAATVAGVFGLALLLEPADFAVYGYATSVMLIAAAIGDLGLGARVIKFGVTNERVRSSFGLQLLVWVPVCAGLALLTELSGAYGLSLLEVGLLVGSFLVLCVQTLPTALLEQRSDFPSVAKIEAGQRVVFVAVALTLAALLASGESIAIATAAAAVVGLIATMLAAEWRWRPSLAAARTEFTGFASDWWQGRVASQMNYAVYPLLGGLLFTAHEVGLIVWALVVTSLPTLLSPLAGRAMFPIISTADEREQIDVFARLYRALLVVSLPIIAALLAVAEPLTLFFFGREWKDGIPLLRLESITALIGVALTPSIALLYTVLDTRRVKLVIIAWTVAMWALTPVVAIWASYLAPSLVQVGAASVVLIVFDQMLRAARGYSLIAEMKAGVVAVAVAAGLGYLAVGLADGRLTTLLLAVGVALVQIAVTFFLKGGLEIGALVDGLRGDRPPVGTNEPRRSSE